MASIKLKGNTSGEITIDVPAVAGTNTLTLPATTGNVVTDSATQTLTNKTLTTPNIDSAQFATVSGTAPLYAARAWVNFNGTGTVAIRTSGNVSSITDNGTGDYTVNFTTAMADADYTPVVLNAPGYGVSLPTVALANLNNSTFAEAAPTTSAFRVSIRTAGNAAYDAKYMYVAIFR
jgi:hypothetical protein